MSAAALVNSHLIKARDAIERGDAFHKTAAEHILSAIKLGASQREAAAKVGKSAAWVNRLLKWQAAGFKETAFGPENKKKRERAAFSQTKQQTKKSDARAEADKARAKAQEAKANASAERARTKRAEADARAARERAKAERERRFANMFGNAFDDEGGGGSEKLDDVSRKRLVKFLGMLGSDQDGERANAAKMADDLRKRLGLSWDELIVKAAALAKAA